MKLKDLIEKFDGDLEREVKPADVDSWDLSSFNWKSLLLMFVGIVILRWVGHLFF